MTSRRDFLGFCVTGVAVAGLVPLAAASAASVVFMPDVALEPAKTLVVATAKDLANLDLPAEREAAERAREGAFAEVIKVSNMMSVRLCCLGSV